MKSPCLDKGNGRPCCLAVENKNNPTCMKCEDRIEYVTQMGGLSESMPLDVAGEIINKTKWLVFVGSV